MPQLVNLNTRVGNYSITHQQKALFSLSFSMNQDLFSINLAQLKKWKCPPMCSAEQFKTYILSLKATPPTLIYQHLKQKEQINYLNQCPN